MEALNLQFWKQSQTRGMINASINLSDFWCLCLNNSFILWTKQPSSYPAALTVQCRHFHIKSRSTWRQKGQCILIQAQKLLVINQTTSWGRKRHVCLCSHLVKCAQARKVLNWEVVTRGFKFFQFGRKILISSKIKDYLVMLVACLLSSDPRLWGTLEDTERWLRHTAGARNGAYNMSNP